MSEGERRIAAIMFTDVVGYSSLSQENEELALELLDEHFRLLRPVIPEYGGTEIKTMGDSFLIQFGSPLQAVKCAIEFQRLLLKRNLDVSPDRHVTIRIGIHLGDVEHRGGDVFGDGVNIASRIEPLADPGGIAVTRQVYDQVHNKIDWELRSLGTPQLKNITTVIEIFRVDLKWDSSGQAIPTRPVGSKLDQKLKIGSVLAVGVIAIVAAFFLIQSLFEPQLVELKPGEITSIAVLPFVNLGSDEEDQYFSDGISEEILNALSQLQGLSVRGRTSSFALRDSEFSIPEIAAKLNVQAVIEGSVRRSGDQVRVTVQMLSASADEHLWSEQFDLELTNIFSAQDEIARSIAEKLKFTVSGEEELVETTTENVEAYALYLQGRFYENKRTEEGLNRAIEFYKQAIDLDPDYALAYTGLADSYSTLALRYDLPGESYPVAKENALKALELDEDLAEAHVSLGLVLMQHDKDLAAAEREFQRALEINPDSALAHFRYAELLGRRGLVDEAIYQIDIAVSLDPLSTPIRNRSGWLARQARQYDAALEHFSTVLEMDPLNVDARIWNALIRFEMGDPDGAEEAFEQALELLPDETRIYEMYGNYLSYWLGRYEDARKLYEQGLSVDPEFYWGHAQIALIETYTGDYESSDEAWKKFMAADPGDAWPHIGYADHFKLFGMSEEAIEQYQLAIEIDPNFTTPYYRMAAVQERSADWDGAEQTYRRVVEVDPDNAWSYVSFAFHHIRRGNLDTGFEVLDQGLNLMENEYTVAEQMGIALFFARRYEESLKKFEEALEINPYGNFTHFWLGAVHLGLGDFESALNEYELVDSALLDPNEQVRLLGGFGMAHALKGDRSAAENDLDKIDELKKILPRGNAADLDKALIYGALGDIETGIHLLNRTYEDQIFDLRLFKSLPFFDPFRDDSRFQELLERIGLAD